MTKRIKTRKRWRRQAQRLPGIREPNGRLSRRLTNVHERSQETERSAMETAVHARMRIFGISEIDAKTQEAGTVIGRMLKAEELSVDQYRAGIAYLEARNAYHSAIGAKSDTGRHPPSETPSAGSYEEFCAYAKSRWSQIASTMARVRGELRSNGPESALELFVVKDEFDARRVGDLRVALNALHRLFMGGERRAA